jgi:hypothetical protein
MLPIYGNIRRAAPKQHDISDKVFFVVALELK